MSTALSDRYNCNTRDAILMAMLAVQGRDGLQSDCLLFFNARDRKRVEGVTQYTIDANGSTETEKGDIDISMRV
jgi:hypothetical protein